MRKIILLILLAISMQIGKSQNEPTHEFSFWAGGGLSSIHYSPSIGEQKAGMGAIAGMGYTYFLNKKWGIGTGLEYGLYNGKVDINNGTDQYITIDSENDPFLWMADINNFEEKQQIGCLNIPLTVQFQTSGIDKFYAILGGKIGIPVSKNYKSTGTYTTKGQYYFTRDPFDNMPEYGYSTYENLKSDDKKLEIGTNFLLTMEAGYKWRLNDDWVFYTGAYFDYGLKNDLRKSKENTENLLLYNPSNPTDYKVHSIAESYYTVDDNRFNFINKMNTIALGVKVRVTFCLGSDY